MDVQSSCIFYCADNRQNTLTTLSPVTHFAAAQQKRFDDAKPYFTEGIIQSHQQK
jgi:predicted RNA-binding protein with PUA-like domain